MKRECEICIMPYDINKHQPRLFGKCGHTICLQCLNQILASTKKNNKNMIRWLVKCPWDQSWYLMNENTGNEIFPINRVFYDELKEITPLIRPNSEKNKNEKEIKKNEKKKIIDDPNLSQQDKFFEDYGLKLEEEKIRNQFIFKKKSESVALGENKTNNNLVNPTKSLFTTDSILNSTVISKDITSPIISKKNFRRKRRNKDLLKKKDKKCKSIKKNNNLNEVFGNKKLKNTKSKKNIKSLKKLRSLSKTKNKKINSILKKIKNSISKKNIKSNRKNKRSESKKKIDKMIKEINNRFRKIFKEKSVEFEKKYNFTNLKKKKLIFPKTKSNQNLKRENSVPNNLSLLKIKKTKQKNHNKKREYSLEKRKQDKFINKISKYSITDRGDKKNHKDRFYQKAREIVNLPSQINGRISIETFTTPNSEIQSDSRQSDFIYKKNKKKDFNNKKNFNFDNKMKDFNSLSSFQKVDIRVNQEYDFFKPKINSTTNFEKNFANRNKFKKTNSFTSLNSVNLNDNKLKLNKNDEIDNKKYNSFNKKREKDNNFEIKKKNEYNIDFLNKNDMSSCKNKSNFQMNMKCITKNNNKDIDLNSFNKKNHEMNLNFFDRKNINGIDLNSFNKNKNVFNRNNYMPKTNMNFVNKNNVFHMNSLNKKNNYQIDSLKKKNNYQMDSLKKTNNFQIDSVNKKNNLKIDSVNKKNNLQNFQMDSLKKKNNFQMDSVNKKNNLQNFQIDSFKKKNNFQTPNKKKNIFHIKPDFSLNKKKNFQIDSLNLKFSNQYHNKNILNTHYKSSKGNLFESNLKIDKKNTLSLNGKNFSGGNSNLNFVNYKFQQNINNFPLLENPL